MRGSGRYIFQVLIAINQLLNALTGGWADEMLSARTYRNRHKPGWGLFMALVDGMFFWQQDHCRACHRYEQIRFRLPPDFRKEGP